MAKSTSDLSPSELAFKRLVDRRQAAAAKRSAELSQVVYCPECRGKRFVVRRRWPAAKEPCTKCKGLGYVTQAVAEKYAQRRPDAYGTQNKLLRTPEQMVRYPLPSGLVVQLGVATKAADGTPDMFLLVTPDKERLLFRLRDKRAAAVEYTPGILPILPQLLSELTERHRTYDRDQRYAAAKKKANPRGFNTGRPLDWPSKAHGAREPIGHRYPAPARAACAVCGKSYVTREGCIPNHGPKHSDDLCPGSGTPVRANPTLYWGAAAQLMKVPRGMVLVHPADKFKTEAAAQTAARRIMGSGRHAALVYVGPRKRKGNQPFAVYAAKKA